ncbi:helix-turn-helix transcriptional regulator [Oceanirhabdus sp. W0125-5]|uniref:helix-turn-helix transcriptional regulator n=1 Tax=Oceanirhabdus sp. W0125-5 TaxID=2999116 RepID=UPI0022F343B2|nr:WYL domain-containing protein [Oceanirhabdus sp. W0125-5]WBW97258.1 WYL domain-containing protein [Oceanirhabdus sp. W0125-5]
MIILLLQTHKSITAKTLAEKLEVSERTIYRDIDVLSSLGVPVYSTRGRTGSIKLMGNFQTSLTGLTQNDIYYFSLPVPKKLIEDLGISTPTDSSYMKLLSNAPEEIKSSLSKINNFLYIDISSWTKETYQTDKSLLLQLQHVVWESLKIEINYEKTNGFKLYNLKPLALVLKRTVWYLVAIDDKCIKNFRVDRINKLEIKSDKFNRPSNFNLEIYWNTTVNTFRKELPKYPVTFEVNEELYNHLKRRKTIRIIEEAFDSSVKVYRLKILFDVEFEAMQFVFEYGNQIKILNPKSLIDSLKSKAYEILKTYK